MTLITKNYLINIYLVFNVSFDLKIGNFKLDILTNDFSLERLLFLLSEEVLRTGIHLKTKLDKNNRTGMTFFFMHERLH